MNDDIYVIIMKYRKAFSNKIKGDEFEIELIDRWEEEVSYYYFLKYAFDDIEYNRLKSFLELYQELSLDEIKQEWITDKALENIEKLDTKVTRFCIKKIKENIEPLSKKEIEDIHDYFENEKENVYSFNKSIVLKYGVNIEKNLKYLLTNDINKSSDYIKNYNYIFNRNNTKKSHR